MSITLITEINTKGNCIMIYICKKYTHTYMCMYRMHLFHLTLRNEYADLHAPKQCKRVYVAPTTPNFKNNLEKCTLCLIFKSMNLSQGKMFKKRESIHIYVCTCMYT